MRRLHPALHRALRLAPFLLLGPLCLRPATAAEVERLSESFSLADSQGLQMILPVGAVRLLPQPRERVAVEVTFHCSGQYYPCRDRLRQVSLVSDAAGEDLRLRLLGPGTWWKTPKTWRLDVEVEVHYPLDTAVALELGQGEVELAGLAANARIEVERGTVQISMAEQSAGAVDLQVPRGRLVFCDPRGRRLGDPGNPFRGSHRVRWSEGEGPVHLEVKVGKGDALVQLQ